jgi:hypothetical protein
MDSSLDDPEEYDRDFKREKMHGRHKGRAFLNCGL